MIHEVGVHRPSICICDTDTHTTTFSVCFEGGINAMAYTVVNSIRQRVKAPPAEAAIVGHIGHQRRQRELVGMRGTLLVEHLGQTARCSWAWCSSPSLNALKILREPHMPSHFQHPLQSFWAWCGQDPCTMHIRGVKADTHLAIPMESSVPSRRLHTRPP